MTEGKKTVKKECLIVHSRHREQPKLLVGGRLTANIRSDTCVIRAGNTSGGRDKKVRKERKKGGS